MHSICLAAWYLSSIESFVIRTRLLTLFHFSSFTVSRAKRKRFRVVMIANIASQRHPPESSSERALWEDLAAIVG